MDRSKPYVVGYENKNVKRIQNDTITAIESAKLKAQTQKDIAIINKDKEIEVEKIKQESLIKKANITKDIEFKKSDTEIVMMDQTLEVQKINSILTVIVVFIIVLLLFYYLHKRGKDKLKIHDAIIQKELYIKEMEYQSQMANRILETLERKNLSPEQEAKLVDTITQTTKNGSENLIDKKSV